MVVDRPCFHSPDALNVADSSNEPMLVYPKQVVGQVCPHCHKTSINRGSSCGAAEPARLHYPMLVCSEQVVRQLLNWCCRAHVVMVLHCCSRAHAAIVASSHHRLSFMKKWIVSPVQRLCLVCARQAHLRLEKTSLFRRR